MLRFLQKIKPLEQILLNTNVIIISSPRKSNFVSWKSRLNFTYTSFVTAPLLSIAVDVEKNQQIGNFSYENILRKVVAENVDATSKFLTNYLLAFLEASTNYKDSLNGLLQLMDKILEQGPYLNNEELEDDVVNARIKMKFCKERFMELLTLLECVEKLANSTAEACYLFGAETASILMSERLFSVTEKLETERKIVETLESAYLKAQITTITKD